jgi:hypothetical protein
MSGFTVCHCCLDISRLPFALEIVQTVGTFWVGDEKLSGGGLLSLDDLLGKAVIILTAPVNMG